MNENDAYAKAKASSSAEDDRVEKALEEKIINFSRLRPLSVR